MRTSEVERLEKDINYIRVKYHNIILLAVGVVVAYYILAHSSLTEYIGSISGLGYVGSFISGILAAYGITAAPGYAAYLVMLSSGLEVPLLALAASAGAVTGNYFIFRFVRNNLMGDIVNLSRDLRIGPARLHLRVKESKLLKRILPLIAGLIFASPVPDEIAAALLGAYHYDSKRFLLYAFGFHFTGFLIIGYLGASV
jgi:hypothetical protein